MITGGMLAEAFLVIIRAAICAFLAFGGAYWIITSWIDKRLQAWEAVGLLAVLLVVLFVVVGYVVQNGFVAVALLVVVTAALVGAVSLYAKAADRRRHQQFDAEDIGKYLEAIDLDPKNVAAHSLLANVYRRQGRLEEALAEYEEAVRLSPDLSQERYWIDRLKVLIERKEQGQDLYVQEALRDSPCPVCGAIISGAETACPECGEYVGKG